MCRAATASSQDVHESDKFCSTPFDFEAMASGHFFEAIANRTGSGRKRQRLLDLTRHPLLPADEQIQSSSQRGCPGDLGGEVANLL